MYEIGNKHVVMQNKKILARNKKNNKRSAICSLPPQNKSGSLSIMQNDSS